MSKQVPPQIDAMSDDAILSAKQLSALMGPSLPTLSRWRSLGRGPPFIRLSACSVGYPLGRYRQWVRAGTCETAPR